LTYININETIGTIEILRTNKTIEKRLKLSRHFMKRRIADDPISMNDHDDRVDALA